MDELRKACEALARAQAAWASAAYLAQLDTREAQQRAHPQEWAAELAEQRRLTSDLLTRARART